jgi:hypothetical protein
MVGIFGPEHYITKDGGPCLHECRRTVLVVCLGIMRFDFFNVSSVSHQKKNESNESDKLRRDLTISQFFEATILPILSAFNAGTKANNLVDKQLNCSNAQSSSGRC